MKVLFNVNDKKLTIQECFFDAVEIFKGTEKIADIPLTNGEGFITNESDIQLNDHLDLYPYNVATIENLEVVQEL